MDDEADAAREYDRLRAELADFVMDALAHRVAEGREPQLSKALVDAIERRVDEAVSARLDRTEFPDPDAFADQVIAAAAGRGGGGGERIETSATRARRNSEGRGGYRAAPERERRGGPGQWALLALLGALILAAAYFGLRYLGGGSADTSTNSVVVNTQTGAVEPPPGTSPNLQQPPANGATPTSAGADVNAAGQTK